MFYCLNINNLLTFTAKSFSEITFHKQFQKLAPLKRSWTCDDHVTNEGYHNIFHPLGVPNYSKVATSKSITLQEDEVTETVA